VRRAVARVLAPAVAAALGCVPAAPPPQVPVEAAAISTATWRAQNAGTGASLRGVAAVSDRVAWVSGSRGTVLRTIDGGATWARLPVTGGDSLDFRSLAATSADTAWLASAGDGAEGQARVFRTTDGGRSWRLVLVDTAKGAFFDAIALRDGRRAALLSDPVGGRFPVWTTDDGASWRRAASIPAAQPGEAAFAAGGRALAVAGPRHAWFVTGGAAGARAFRSTDGGRTWTAAPVPVSFVRSASSGLFAVAFRDTLHGVAVGGDYAAPRGGVGDVSAIHTDDGGRSWRPASRPPRGYWSGLAWIPGAPSTVVAVGLRGTAVSRDGGRSWAVVDSLPLHAVAAAGPAAVWAVGPRGRVVRVSGEGALLAPGGL
jgi:photosystem II stability/assembly factor-like uncharacterized protein